MFILLLHMFDSLMSSFMFFVLILFIVLSILLLLFEEFFDAMVSFVPRSYYFVDFILLLFILCSQISFNRLILFLRFSISRMSNPFNWRKRCFNTNLGNIFLFFLIFFTWRLWPLAKSLITQLL